MTLCLLCIVPGGGTLSVLAAGEESRVFDEAGLFTSQETAELEAELSAAKENYKMDFAIVTTLDAMGMTTEEFADDFYVSQDLGVGNDYSGVLCVIDMDNRQYQIFTMGEMMRYLTDERVADILDAAAGYMGDGDYARAAATMVSDISGYMGAGIVEGQYNYDEETGKVDAYKKRSLTWYEILFALAAAGAVAVLPCMSTVKQYKMEDEQKQALNYHLAYRGASAFAFTLANDMFINKMVSQRRIQQNIGGGPRGGGGGSTAGRTTMRRGGSGRMHGGGGRGF